MNDAITIRLATVADAETLTELARRTFEETFARDNSAEDMHAYVTATFGVKQQTRELNDPTITTFLVEQDGVAIAYTQLRSGRAPSSVGTRPAVEIARFYVDQAAHGRGVAQRLMRTIEEHARDRDCSLLWLGVWERNARAIAFYRKCGFEAVAKQTFVLGSDVQTDDVMRRELSS